MKTVSRFGLGLVIAIALLIETNTLAVTPFAPAPNDYWLCVEQSPCKEGYHWVHCITVTNYTCDVKLQHECEPDEETIEE